MVNTILAKRVNHIVAKGGNPVWPKGSKSRGFSRRSRLALRRSPGQTVSSRQSFRTGICKTENSPYHNVK